jgi:protein gp37
MSRNRLRRIIEWYIPRWLPIDDQLRRVPRVGRFLIAVVPCWNPYGLFDLSGEDKIAWTILDTFDALAPRYDNPQSVEDVEAWCKRASLEDVTVRYGGNGVEVTARRRQ